MNTLISVDTISQPTSSPEALLPEGYVIESGVPENYNEICELIQTSHIGEDTTAERVKDAYAYYKEIDMQVFGVSVRDASNGELVGFGAMVHGDGVGYLGDFVVNPEHQGLGIGKAIIRERLAEADRQGLDRIMIEDMEPTNTLLSYYLENGFVQHPYGRLIKILPKFS